ncbi:MAG: DUF4178 domain-containing protein [Paracoccaceae bacterium]
MNAAEAKQFNCTECGAGLDVLGGGRVRVHGCSYCGAQLDVQDDYRVIAQYRDMVRPKTPYDLGMKGMLWGAEFTVIGTIAWLEQHQAQTWEWVDHQIYSPTHGYAWLTVDNGFITFTRKSRSVTSPANVSEATIENSEHRPSVRLGGETFTYYGSGRARPTFIEGEFNYVPTMLDRSRYVSLLGKTQMLAIRENSSLEREYELSDLPDQAEALLGFGVVPERLPYPVGVHPLQILDRSPFQLFARNLFLAAAVIAVLGMFFTWIAGERVAASQRTSVKDGISLPFTVTQANRLTEITVWADARNSWAWFDAELTDQNGETVAAYNDGVAYYQGREGGESWSEGSQRVKTKLALPPGEYQIDVALSDAEVDWRNGNVAREMQVSVKQGLMNPLWMILSAILFAILGGAFLVTRFFHNSRRWAGSDWSD